MRLALFPVGPRWAFYLDGRQVSEHGDQASALAALVAAATPLVASGALRPLTAALPPDPGAGDDTEAGLLPERWVGAPAIAYNAPTGDGRDLTDCVFSWRDPAAGLVPLMLALENQGGHFGAGLAGFTESFGTVPAGVTAAGRFYETDDGITFRDLLLGGRSFGVSVDGGQTDIEWQCVETDPVDDFCTKEVALVHALEVIGLTGTPFPAFAEAAIALESTPAADATTPDTEDPATPADTAPPVPAAVAASAAPLRPPTAWLTRPEPDAGHPDLVPVEVGQHGEATSFAVPLTITDAGEVYGHLAVWGQCHVGYPGVCVEPPSSPSGYAHFNIGTTVTDDGRRIGTGALVVGCDHAGARLFANAARDHYAHNGLKWANVRASEGQYGIWVAGALLPGLTDEQVAAIHGSGLSGDWRDIGGALELVAALTVPVPGFPLVRRQALAAAAGLTTYIAPKPAAYVANGVQVSLVAAGRVRRCTSGCGEHGRRRPAAAEPFARLHPDDRRLLEVLERRTRPAHRDALLARIDAATGR